VHNDDLSKKIAYMGILAGVLLLVGDFTVGVVQSDIITMFFAAGYVLMMIWLFLIAGRLFQPSLSGMRP
jgi:hypothetical protein